MTATLQIAFKEFRLLFRSKRRILWLFSTTFIILGIGIAAGFIFLFVGEQAPVSLIAGQSAEFEGQNGGAALKALCEQYTEENFTIMALENVDQRLEEKDFDVLVVLPTNFTGLLSDNRTAVNATVQIYYDAGDLTSLQLKNDVELAIQHLNSAIVLTEYEITKSLWVAPDLHNVAEGVGEFGAALLAMIPLYGMLMLAMPAVSLTLISITVEREQKTLEPLLLSKISRRSVVWGKLLYGLLLIAISLGLNILSIVITVLLFAIMTENNVKNLVRQSGELGEFIGLDALSVGFLGLGLVVLSMLLVAICVLLSFIAKDEREGQMLTSAIIGIPSILVITFLFLPFADFPLWLQLLFAIMPLFGFLQSGYLVFLNGGVGVVAMVGLLSQLGWLVLTIWVTARLMESEGILEVSISALPTFILSLFRRSGR
ncbi:MAG: ABC transporter permease [Candidatus Hodarchaeales archaeon]|jgi:ABC-type Na+ efflux pump permease subunit